MAAVSVSGPPRGQLRDELPGFRHAIYLDSGSLGALAVRSRAQVNEYLDLWEQRGAAPAREMRSGTVTLPRTGPAQDVRRFAEAGIVVDARPGHARVAPDFYNVPDDHLALVELLQP